MKRIIPYALFGAIFAITVGILGVSHMSATTFGLAGDVPTTDQDGMKITGHITLVATDPNGNIKAYRQTDNIVVSTGADCVTRLLFGGTTGTGRGLGSGTTTCIGGLNQPWTVIAIGTGTTAETVSNTGLQTELTTGGLNRQQGTVTYINATSNTPQGTSAAIITNQFSSTTTAAVSESGLFNSTTVSGSGMFARQAFTAINLVSGDKLTIAWTVNTT